MKKLNLIVKVDFKSPTAIINRYNDAVYEVAMLLKASKNENVEMIRTHKANASRALYETFEGALKNHILNNGEAYERRNLYNLNIEQLYDKFENCKIPLYDDIVENVDLDFLKRERAIINKEKHELKDNTTAENLTKYILELKKFILTYITPNELKLKSIEEFAKMEIPNWDSFYNVCDKFNEEERNYILIISKSKSIDNEYLKNLSIPKWDLIIDFDYYSRDNGFYKVAFGDSSPEPHIMKPNDIFDSETFSLYPNAHYHYFIKGYNGSGIPEIKDYDNWQRYEKGFEKLIEHFVTKFDLNTKIITVSEEISDEFIYNIFRVFRKNLKDKAEFIFALVNKTEFEFSIKKFQPHHIPISIPEISEGLGNYSLNFGQTNSFKDKYLLPFLENTETKGVTGVISTELYAELEEDFEVLHKGIPENIIENNEDRRDFLCGFNSISWFGLKERFDVERRNFNKTYIKPIEKAIEGVTGKIYLVHEAGFGGTTIGRRIAWEFHNEYPTLILKKYRGEKTISKIVQLHTLTRKTIFVVLEVPQALSLDEVEFFYKSIPKTRPVVFLIIRRGKPNPIQDLVVSDWGNDCYDLIKTYKPFLKEYNNPSIEIAKEKELDEIINAPSSEGYKKTPFYIGLITFDEKFFGIKSYIKNFYDEIRNKEEYRKTILYLSLCHDYLGQGLPSSFFANIFNQSQNNEIFYLENYFPKNSSIIGSLIIPYFEGKQKYWIPRHVLFSREIKQQILSSGSDSEETWKYNLADYCIKFIEDSVTEGQTSEYTQELLQKIFIGTRRERAGETFTAIINDSIIKDDQRRIINQEKIEGIFKCLKESYPYNPHYCSHLARFYAYKYKNRELAMKYADEAIRLSEMEDPLLYHIKGMCLREASYDSMKLMEENKRKGKLIPDSEINHVLEVLIPQAGREFEFSRKTSKEQNKTDEHGYIAHIQMLIRAIDFGSIILEKPKSKLISENKEPFAEWLDLAESLLEDIKRNHYEKDDNGKIDQCEDGINNIYENYDLILQSLRNQLDRGKNLGRLRRQIVRTYFKKEESDIKSNQKVINNILDLMEKNIEVEPHNERNFYLWFQAARYSNEKLEDAVSKLGRWKVNSNSIDALFYFYILKVLRGLQGYTEDAIFAEKLIKECKQRGKGNTNIYEWYGKGQDLKRLVGANTLSDHEKEDKLEYVRGYVTAYNHEGDATITIENKLEVYFSPTKAGLTEDILGREVEFFLGFSHDGLRADSFSVKRISNKTKQISSPVSFFKISDLDNNDFESLITKKQTPPVENKKLTQEPSTNKNIKKISSNCSGVVIDLKYPPNYIMGSIESPNNKKYFFHKNNEDKGVFDLLKIGSKVLFDIGKNERGEIAYNLKLE